MFILGFHLWGRGSRNLVIYKFTTINSYKTVEAVAGLMSRLSHECVARSHGRISTQNRKMLFLEILTETDLSNKANKWRL